MIRSRIETALDSNTPLLIGRFGTIEFTVLWNFLIYKKINPDYLTVLERNAGVFGDSAAIAKWCEEYEKACSSADILATGWHPPIVVREQELLKRMKYSGAQCVLRALEPYYWPVEERWFEPLHRQKVCVVSSFVHTIASQIKKGERRIWPDGNMWPSAEWSFVKTGYAPSLALGRAGWECDNLESWETCVDHVVGEVMKTLARVVLIGCGGLGMIIAGRLQASGKICIVMGGAIQVLFGIKGRRWEDHQISGFWNSDWVAPSESETPAGAIDVERGCYWF